MENQIISGPREDAQTRRIPEERTTFSAALPLPPFNLVGSLFFRHQIIGESLDGCFRPSLLRAGLNTGTLKVQPGNSASSARYKIVAPPDGCVAGSHLYHCFILSPPSRVHCAGKVACQTRSPDVYLLAGWTARSHFWYHGRAPPPDLQRDNVQTPARTYERNLRTSAVDGTHHTHVVLRRPAPPCAASRQGIMRRLACGQGAGQTLPDASDVRLKFASWAVAF